MKVNAFAVDNFNSSIDLPSSYVNIGKPKGILMLPDGKMWYYDTLNSRLVKYDPADNTILRTVGRGGFDEGEFGDGGFNSITRDSEGNLYAVDYNSVVMKFDPNGGYIKSWNSTGASWATSITYDSFSDSIFVTSTHPTNCKIYKFTTDMVYLDSFGDYDGTWGLGEGDNPNCPNQVATDSAGNIYVTSGNIIGSGLRKFDSDFNLELTITSWDAGHENLDAFVAPAGIVILSNGTIVVASQNSNSVIEFDSDGNYIGDFGGQGTFDGNMAAPAYLAKDSDDNIYVSDWGINSITKFNSEGTYISVLRNASLDECKIYGGLDVAYDSSGNMYLLDVDADRVFRVQKWNADGSCAGVVIPKGDLSGDSYVLYIDASDRMFISGDSNVRVFELISGTWQQTNIFGTGGSDEGQFNQARGISVSTFTGHVGHMYVSDLGNHRIQEFDENFTWVNSFGTGWNGYDDYSPLLDGELKWPEGLAVTSGGDIIVADEHSVQRFSANGAFIDYLGVPYVSDCGDYNTLGAYCVPIDVMIDASQNIFVGDTQWHRVTKYDSNGNYLTRFGTFGSGQGQYNEPGGIGVDPITGNISVSDNGNSRIETYSSGKVRIYNLIPSAKIISLDSGETNGLSISDNAWPIDSFTDVHNIPARMVFGDYVVAEFTVDLSQDRNWSLVNVITLPSDSKSLVVNLNITAAPGISGTHSLYVYKYANQQTVTVCPSANTLDGVTEGCPGEYVLYEGDSNLSIVTINSDSYWKIDGLTGTGAFSSLFTTSFLLRDLMTRQMVSTASNHEILFGTTYDVTHSGDTITLSFDATAWDLSTIHWEDGDIILRGGSTDFVLDDSAGSGIWGVNIALNNDETLYQIIFTAPTDGNQYIEAGNFIHIFINNDVLINPDTPGTYLISMRLLTDDGIDQTTESGSVNVAIVDSDQVNISGYVNAFMSFDIDTGILSSVDCGPTDCAIHDGDGALAGLNYTVDLGELKSTDVNRSNDAAVMHSDGISGVINSIYFDLSTNANGGAVVTVSSANEGLQGLDESKITSLGIDVGTDGDNIAANSGLYGFNVPVSEASRVAGGEIVPNGYCHDANTYCGPTTSIKEVFNTSSSPIDTARVRMDITAAAAYTNTPGLYSDTLTFVATATF